MTNNCTGPQRLSAYYAGAGIIPLGTVGFPYGVRTTIPVTGPISISNFYGAQFDAGQFINGDFEIVVGVTEDSLRYNMVGWTVLKQHTRLNANAQIESCFTPNQINTPTPAPPVGITSPGDNVTFNTGIAGNPSFRMRLLDTSDPLYASLASGGTSRYIMELRNSATFAGLVAAGNPNLYGILRGPVVISNNSVVVGDGDVVSFKWRAARDPQGDKFSVYIYMVRSSDCATITLLDSTGESTSWATVNYTINSAQAGQYKFVVVHGSYDSAGGLKVGAYLYLDDIKLTKASAPVGQTTTTTSTSTTTTQAYTYNGAEELYLTPGTLLNRRTVNGGDIYEYQVSVLDNCQFGIRNAKPANVGAGGIPPVIIDLVSGWDQTGNLWLPGPSGNNPVGGAGLYNEINASGEFKYPYSNITFRIPGDKFTRVGGIDYEMPTNSPFYYQATVDGGGNGRMKAMQVTRITTPITVSAATLPTIETAAPYATGYSSGTRVVFEGDQATFSVTDSRNTTGLLNWRVRPVGFVTSANAFFVGGTVGDYVLTGQVSMNNGLGQVTIQTVANTYPQSGRSIRMEIVDPATQRLIGLQSLAFLDRPYTGQAEFTTAGTYTWTVPTGVWSVSAVCVGGGGGGSLDATNPTGGAGGNLQWRNSIPVVPGTVYTVVVGAGGTAGNVTYASGGAGSESIFGLTSSLSTANVAARGGNGGSTIGIPAAPGSLHNPGDGSPINVGYGGTSSPLGGAGGAGGYTGNGGAGATSTGANGNGGGGGGGSSNGGGASAQGGAGGGVGILGQGGNGIGGTQLSSGGPLDGTAGSGGNAQSYGGGGGGLKPPATQAMAGSSGAVRIIWGPNRTFPATNTGNLPVVS